jgi:hypothetical protein
MLEANNVKHLSHALRIEMYEYLRAIVKATDLRCQGHLFDFLKTSTDVEIFYKYKLNPNGLNDIYTFLEIIEEYESRYQLAYLDNCLESSLGEPYLFFDLIEFVFKSLDFKHTTLDPFLFEYDMSNLQELKTDFNKILEKHDAKFRLINHCIIPHMDSIQENNLNDLYEILQFNNFKNSTNHLEQGIMHLSDRNSNRKKEGILEFALLTESYLEYRFKQNDWKKNIDKAQKDGVIFSIQKKLFDYLHGVRSDSKLGIAHSSDSDLENVTIHDAILYVNISMSLLLFIEKKHYQSFL